MQPVVFEDPYEFVPPHRGRIWPRILQQFLPRRLRREYGIERVECPGAEHLRHSLDAGHGVLLAPNHCRPADPMVVCELCRQIGTLPFLMASWHLFKVNAFQRFLLRRAGAFSVYREGMDRQALSTAVEILTSAERPLVVFPEGVVTRTNDRLVSMMEGVSFMARSAAKKREAEQQVVVHPIAIRYHFHGDLEASAHQALDDIETRLSWRPKRQGSLPDRIFRVGQALLWLKEIEYLGEPQTGSLEARLARLIDQILGPIEQEWLGKTYHDRDAVSRVKQLRTAILRDMIDGKVSEAERARRWDQLAAMYIAQQMGHYPPHYIRSNPTPERILETVERFEEDLTDVCRIYRPMSATVHVGEAIPVSTQRVRGGDDPVMSELERQMHAMLEIPQGSGEAESAEPAPAETLGG